MNHRTTALLDGCAYDLCPSPFGELPVVASNEGVHAIFWPDALENPQTRACISRLERSSEHPVCVRAIAQLGEYFSAARRTFDIPLVLKGSRFQRSAWNALREIPYGQTLSYEAQAIRIGGKEKARAVGRANGANPIPILIPCHRVIGKNGALTGFGGGLSIKTFLLELESGR